MIDSFAHHTQTHSSSQVMIWGVFFVVVVIIGISAAIYSRRKDKL